MDAAAAPPGKGQELQAMSPVWAWGELVRGSYTLPLSLLRASLQPKQNNLTASLERTELNPGPQTDGQALMFAEVPRQAAFLLVCFLVTRNRSQKTDFSLLCTALTQ